MSPLLLLAAVLAQAAPATVEGGGALSQFRTLCIQTGADLPAVTAAAADQSWTLGGRAGALQTWSKPAAARKDTLVAGVNTDGRLVCNLRLQPGVPGIEKLLPGVLGAGATPVNRAKGIYLLAPSADAVRRGEAAFVSADTANDTTTLLYIRRKR